MAWVAPPTFVSGNVLTAAQMNTLSGDLNETAAAKATAAGQTIVTTAANTLAARTIGHANITVGDQNTTSTSYVDLLTTGPSTTITTGTTVMTVMSMTMTSDTVGGYAEALIQWNGTTFSTFSLRMVSAIANAKQNLTRVAWESTLTPGSNTFKIMYRAQVTGNAIFNARDLIILPID